MAPRPKNLDIELVKSVARELAQTERNPSRSKLASRLGVIESTMNKRLRDMGEIANVDALLHPPMGVPPERAGAFAHEDGTATVVSDPANQPPAPWKPEALLKAHGLDPKEWEITRVRSNRWGDPGEPQHQLRVDVVPRHMLIVAPDPSSWTPPPKAKAKKLSGGEPRKIVVCGDHHAPLHDRTLHSLFLDWLADEQPDEGVVNGDLCDFHDISRHRNRDGFAAPVNECLEAAFGILRDYRHASPNTKWKVKKGNHDSRLEDGIVDNIRGLHKIAAAGDEVPALSLRRLLHLDELDIELVDEDWDMAKIRLSKKLSVRHGPATGKAATQRLLDKFSVSVIQNHTHRLSMLYRTEHSDDDDEPTTTRMAAEGGCMCQIHQGLGYADSPDWNQGFLVTHVWDNGDFHTAPVPYVPGRLLAPGGRRYAA